MHVGRAGADVIDDPLQRADVIEVGLAAGTLPVASTLMRFPVEFVVKTSANCPL